MQGVQRMLADGWYWAGPCYVDDVAPCLKVDGMCVALLEANKSAGVAILLPLLCQVNAHVSMLPLFCPPCCAVQVGKSRGVYHQIGVCAATKPYEPAALSSIQTGNRDRIKRLITGPSARACPF